MSTEPALEADVLLPIDQVASTAGLASSALRYYERCGLIEQGRKVSGRRHYPPSVLRRLTTIRSCQALGFSLSEIAELLDESADGQVWRDLSRVRREQVRSDIDELRGLLEVLDTTVDCTCRSLRDCPVMDPDGRLAHAVRERGRPSRRPPGQGPVTSTA